MACEKCMPRTFCFCSTLDRGAFIIGIVSVVLSVLSIVGILTGAERNNSSFYGGIINSILLLIGGICLIIAVRKARPSLCWPYMIFSAFVCLICFIAVIGSIISLDIGGGLINFLIAALELYFLLVVISYYRSLNSSVVVSSA